MQQRSFVQSPPQEADLARRRRRALAWDVFIALTPIVVTVGISLLFLPCALYSLVKDYNPVEGMQAGWIAALLAAAWAAFLLLWFPLVRSWKRFLIVNAVAVSVLTSLGLLVLIVFYRDVQRAEAVFGILNLLEVGWAIFFNSRLLVQQCLAGLLLLLQGGLLLAALARGIGRWERRKRNPLPAWTAPASLIPALLGLAALVPALSRTQWPAIQVLELCALAALWGLALFCLRGRRGWQGAAAVCCVLFLAAPTALHCFGVACRYAQHALYELHTTGMLAAAAAFLALLFCLTGRPRRPQQAANAADVPAPPQPAAGAGEDDCAR